MKAYNMKYRMSSNYCGTKLSQIADLKGHRFYFHRCWVIHIMYTLSHSPLSPITRSQMQSMHGVLSLPIAQHLRFPSHTPYKTMKHLCCRLHRCRVWGHHFNVISLSHTTWKVCKYLFSPPPNHPWSRIRSYHCRILLPVRSTSPSHTACRTLDLELPVTQPPTTQNMESSLVLTMLFPTTGSGE